MYALGKAALTNCIKTFRPGPRIAKRAFCTSSEAESCRLLHPNEHYLLNISQRRKRRVDVNGSYRALWQKGRCASGASYGKSLDRYWNPRSISRAHRK